MDEALPLEPRYFEEPLVDRLLSEAAFEDRLKTLLAAAPLKEFAFRLELKNDGETWQSFTSADAPVDTDPVLTRPLPKLEEPFACTCTVWRRGSGRTDPDVTIAPLCTLIGRHIEGRDRHTALPSLKFPGVEARFLAAARAMADRGSAVVHLDLDDFKTVNSEHGEPGGDKVLGEFAKRLRQAFAGTGLIVRTGGDEFSALLDACDLPPLLEKLTEFRQAMGTTPFALLQRPNGCSIGVAIYPAGHEAPPTNAGLNALLNAARGAQARAKTEGRDRICLSAELETRPYRKVLERADLIEAALRMRRFTAACSSRDLTGAILQLAMSRLHDLTLAEVPALATALSAELGLQIGYFESPDERPLEWLGAFEPLQWAILLGQALFAVAFERQGPLQADDRLAIEIDSQHTLALLLEPAGAPEIRIVVGVVASTSAPQKLEVGRADHNVSTAGGGRLRKANSEMSGHSLSTVLLLPIGDQAGDIAEQMEPLVAEVVQIDDRPSRGGGLPDFWQSNLSRVIHASLKNPNIAMVLAVGDPDSARQTLKWLRDPGHGELDLQQRIRLPVVWIKTYLRRGLAVRVAPADRDQVFEQLHAASIDDAPIDYGERDVIDVEQTRSRRRLFSAEPDSAQRLDLFDGLRTRSLADAYPQALQLIRADGGRPEHQEARRAFRETSAFKLVLTRPLTDITPEFWDSEKGLLETYYQSNFIAPAGLFGRKLSGGHGAVADMRAFAARATAEAIRHHQPTRRIHLPVVSDELDQPLGLSAIQILPRVHEGRWRLDAIWVWRTVDALVGFPFSAYGSICWTRDFLAEVRALLAQDDEVPEVVMGELTYLALSFHLYLHEGDREIARAIVHDASR